VKKSKVESMTIDETLKHLSDSMLVQTKLVERFEQRVAEQQEITEARLSRRERQVDDHTEQMQEFRQAMVRLFEEIERFVRGRRGDGQTPSAA
jgi:chaperonin cofactor prefoldin